MHTSVSRISTIKKIILWSIIIGGLISLFIPALVHGEAGKPTDPCDSIKFPQNSCIKGTNDLKTDLTTGSASDSVTKTIIVFARILTFVSAGLAILFIVIGGVRMITSNGNDSQYKSALTTIQYAIIGLVVTAVAYSAISIISGVLTTINISG
jgi:Type IV secretion system pilin